MTDLLLVLPGFVTQPYTHLIPSLEKNLVTTTDLLTLDAVDIAKRAKLPLPDVRKLCAAVLQELQGNFGLGEVRTDGDNGIDGDKPSSLRRNGEDLAKMWRMVSTLDGTIDKALGGGIPTGYIAEITGESGAGKTQFLLGLLLAAQLPPPNGLSKSALYISTESGLPTIRLSQMLRAHPILSTTDPKPSLDRIMSIVTPDLESQDHILRYQVPVAIQRHNIGLVVIDSVASNYRAEFERPGENKNGANMAKRSSDLIKLGQFLRDLARTENIAVVVANQVSDRFTSSSSASSSNTRHVTPITHNPKPSLLAPRSSDSNSNSSNTLNPTPINPSAPSPRPTIPQTTPMPTSTPLTLDHQQRWFTGWGDDPSPSGPYTSLKTPSLGLVWTSQIACRITLLKSADRPSAYVPDPRDLGGASRVGFGGEGGRNGGAGTTGTSNRERKMWRRWLKVVFAPWAAASGVFGRGDSSRQGMGVGMGPVEFRIMEGGIEAL